MENAEDMVKEVVDTVTFTNSEDGIDVHIKRRIIRYESSNRHRFI